MEIDMNGSFEFFPPQTINREIGLPEQEFELKLSFEAYEQTDLEAARSIFEEALSGIQSVSPEYPYIKNLEDLWTAALPWLTQSKSNGGPVVHTAHVFSIASQIGQAQQMSDDDLFVLLTAAIYHDVGFAELDKNEKKISASAIRNAEPQERKELLEKAIRIRKAHMNKGAEMFRRIADEHVPLNLYNRVITIVPDLIKMHDNPTVAQLILEVEGSAESDGRTAVISEANPALEELVSYLFSSSELCGKNVTGTADNIAPLLREADRLWMLTIDGVCSDIFRSTPVKIKTPQDQLTYNRGRHMEEATLYIEALDHETAKKMGIGNEEDAFYRSQKGKELFRSLYADTKEYFEGKMWGLGLVGW